MKATDAHADAPQDPEKSKDGEETAEAKEADVGVQAWSHPFVLSLSR